MTTAGLFHDSCAYSTRSRSRSALFWGSQPRLTRRRAEHSILLDVDVMDKSAWSVHRRVQEICRTELSLLL